MAEWGIWTWVFLILIWCSSHYTTLACWSPVLLPTIPCEKISSLFHWSRAGIPFCPRHCETNVSARFPERLLHLSSKCHCKCNDGQENWPKKILCIAYFPPTSFVTHLRSKGWWEIFWKWWLLSWLGTLWHFRKKIGHIQRKYKFLSGSGTSPLTHTKIIPSKWEYEWVEKPFRLNWILVANTVLSFEQQGGPFQKASQETTANDSEY